MDKQLFLLNSSLNDAILRTRDECVLVWELQLLGIQSGKVYSLLELQSSYKAAAKVLEIHAPYIHLYYLLHVTLHCACTHFFSITIWLVSQYASLEIAAFIDKVEGFEDFFKRTKDLQCMLDVSNQTLAADTPNVSPCTLQPSAWLQ